MSENKEELSILTNILGRGYKSGTEHLFYCPKCKHHKKKLSVYDSINKIKCWICDYRGTNVRRIVRKYGSFRDLRSWDEVTKSFSHELLSFEALMAQKLATPSKTEGVEQRISLPEQFRSLTSTKLPITASPALRFLQDRGVTKKDILRWKIGYCSSGEYGGRIVIPSFNNSGYVDYFVGRSYTGDWRKYLSPAIDKNIVFNDLYIDWDSDLVIVEGVFDAFVAGYAVPILGSSISDKSKLFSKIAKHDTPVYIALDADAEKKAMKLIKQLMEYDVELYKVELGGYSDVGEMTKKEFSQRKDEARQMNSSSYISKSISLA